MFKIDCSDLLHWLMKISVGGAIILLMATSLHAQPVAFQKAAKAYEAYDYEEATALFSKVAYDSSVEEDIRRQALQYLGQIYVAEDRREKARGAIEQLVGLEPPPAELDPNRYPPSLVEMYYKVCKEKRGGYGVREEDPGLQTLAIMDFENNSVDQQERFDPLSAAFPSEMVNYLNGTTDLEVIERQRVKWLLDELELQRKADVVDQSTAVRAGKLLGATTVLFGNYTVFEDQMRVNARLVKVETGEILLGQKVKGEPDEFPDLIEELSRDITREINVEMEEDVKTRSTTQFLDARLAFSEGNREFENGNYRAAREKFEEALEHDSNYKAARQRLEVARAMLASSESSGETGGLEER
jgi:TolB-like protein